MIRYLFFAFILIIFSANSCVTPLERQKKEYGLLETAVTFSSDKVIGEYDDSIPVDFDTNKFLQLVKDKIPEDYYDALNKYRLNILPKDTYYLLKAYDDERLILFDYSCTTEIDGPVLLEIEKYDLDNLEIYDKCK